MIRIILLLLTASIVHSCALNKIFLDPIVTVKSDEYKVYSPEFQDTISLAFHPTKTPFSLIRIMKS